MFVFPDTDYACSVDVHYGGGVYSGKPLSISGTSLSHNFAQGMYLAGRMQLMLRISNKSRFLVVYMLQWPAGRVV